MTPAILDSLIQRAERAAKQGTSPIMLPRELNALLGTLEHALNCMDRHCEPCNALWDVFLARSEARNAGTARMVDARGSEVISDRNGEGR
jgi:hypothetical protein